MSLKDLQDLRTRVDAAISQREGAERENVKKRLEELAAKSGFALKDLVATKRGATKGSKIAAKYRNPKNPSETWSGRGRQPLWLVAKLKAGARLQSFLIG